MKPEVVRRACLDASCLIGIVQGEEAFRPLRSLLQGISAGSVELLASTALLAEFLPNHPRSNKLLAHDLRNLLKTQATLLDVTPSVADLACELRELYGMSTWDAVHLATSITGKADVLFVRDNKFPVDQLVQGVWVSAPFDIEGEHLFSDLDSEPGK